MSFVMGAFIILFNQECHVALAPVLPCLLSMCNLHVQWCRDKEWRQPTSKTHVASPLTTVSITLFSGHDGLATGSQPITAYDLHLRYNKDSCTCMELFPLYRGCIKNDNESESIGIFLGLTKKKVFHKKGNHNHNRRMSIYKGIPV